MVSERVLFFYYKEKFKIRIFARILNCYVDCYVDCYVIVT